MRVGIYTGSFDPLTLGHAEIIFAAGRMFDRLVTAVGVNASKTPIFSAAERAELIRSVCADRLASFGCELVVERFSGLAVAAAHAFGARTIVRGLRDGTDFDFEMRMAGTNAALASDIQTIFLPAASSVRHISATLVRQIARMGGDVSVLAPPAVVAALALKLGAASP